MQDNISILIIEDEEVWAQKLRIDLEQFGFTIAGVVDCIEDALPLILRKDFDITLIDINLNGKNSGIELGNMINQQIQKPFIFITGSTQDNLIIQAAAVHPSAFLTKPMHTASLFVSIQSAIHHFQSGLQKPVEKNRDKDSPYFFVKSGNRYKKVEWLDVLFLRSEKNYTVVVNKKNESFLIRSSLHRMLQYVIPGTLRNNFIQVNRAEVLQINHIDEILQDEAIIGSQSFSITESYNKELKQRLNMMT